MTNNAPIRHGTALAAYVVVGGVCAVVEWSVFWVLLNLAGVHYVIAALVAFVLATFANYLLCIRTIFASKTSSVRSDIARVYIASAIAYSVNLLVFIALVNEFAVGPMAAKMAGTGVGFLLNFASRQFLIFAPSAWLSSRRSATDRH